MIAPIEHCPPAYGGRVCRNRTAMAKPLRCAVCLVDKYDDSGARSKSAIAQQRCGRSCIRAQPSRPSLDVHAMGPEAINVGGIAATTTCGGNANRNTVPFSPSPIPPRGLA